MKEKHTYRHVNARGNLPEALRANPYTVPDGYFENLHHHTIRKCRDTDTASIAWAVPPGYFEQLEDSITAKIAEQKLRTIVGEPGFSVPESYFDTLQTRVAELTGQKVDTPIRKISISRWVAYAAAASIALVMGIAGIFRMADGDAAKSPLASVSDQQILDYLEFYGAPNDVIYISEQFDDFDERGIGEGSSEEEIEAYLNHTL